MSRLLVISPHLDDAVLSCGGSIAARAARGDAVMVATVMSGGDERYAERTREDRRALERLGARPTHLGVPDAPFRQARYRSYREIVFGDERLDEADLELVTTALRPLLESRPDEVWAPLGAGGHVDHRLCHAAARALAAAPRVSFYEDRPYALAEAQVAIRFRELGATPAAGGDAAPRTSPAAEAFLRRYMVDDDDRTFCEARLDEARRSLARGARTAGAHRLGGDVLERRATPLANAGRRALVAAIASYGSQLPSLLGDATDPETAVAALYGEALGAEARWTPR